MECGGILQFQYRLYKMACFLAGKGSARWPLLPAMTQFHLRPPWPNQEDFLAWGWQFHLSAPAFLAEAFSNMCISTSLTRVKHLFLAFYISSQSWEQAALVPLRWAWYASSRCLTWHSEGQYVVFQKLNDFAQFSRVLHNEPLRRAYYKGKGPLQELLVNCSH